MGNKKSSKKGENQFKIQTTLNSRLATNFMDIFEIDREHLGEQETPKSGQRFIFREGRKRGIRRSDVGLKKTKTINGGCHRSHESLQIGAVVVCAIFSVYDGSVYNGSLC